MESNTSQYEVESDTSRTEIMSVVRRVNSFIYCLTCVPIIMILRNIRQISREKFYFTRHLIKDLDNVNITLYSYSKK